MSTRSSRSRPITTESSPVKTRKGASPSRSPGRQRNSPPRSPSRKGVSPSRSPGRARKSSPTGASKSPSRKNAQYPARKSPSRATKETPEVVTQKSPSKRAGIKDFAINLQDVTSNLEIYRSNRGRRVEYSLSDIASSIASEDVANGLETIAAKEFGIRARKPVEEIVPRRSTRLQETAPIRRSLSSKSKSDTASKSLDAYSDEENSEEDQKFKIKKKLVTPQLNDSFMKWIQINNRWEFGGRIGTGILTLLLPLAVLSIITSCSKLCSLKAFQDLATYKSLAYWFSLKSTLIFGAQISLQAAFALIPVCGRNAEKYEDSTEKYCFNALFANVMTSALLVTLDYLKITESCMLLNEYVKLGVLSYIFGVILSVALYWRSRKLDDGDLNPYGNTGYPLYDFCIGREIHPHFKKLDVKIWISRISNVTTLILAALIFQHGIKLDVKNLQKLNLENYKEEIGKVQLHPTILVFTAMQLIYIMMFVMKEHKITSTFFWQSEGVGYLQIVGSLLYPYYFTSITKFVAESQLSLSTNVLIIASALYMVGLMILLISNNIKHEFRKNPSSLTFTKLESMPTFQGKRLLTSGLWGIVRHPNYTGDILIHIALALPGILTKNYIAAAPALLTIMLLLHRAWRDHARCKKRYAAAWQRYCKRVPSAIIPKVL